MNKNIKHRASIKDPALKKKVNDLSDRIRHEIQNTAEYHSCNTVFFFLSNDDGLAAIKILMDGRDCVRIVYSIVSIR